MAENNTQVNKDINSVATNGEDKERALERLNKVSENAVAEYGKTLVADSNINTAEKAQTEINIEMQTSKKDIPSIGGM